MITILTLVCIGGVSYLYSRLIYLSCCTNENNNDIPIISTTNSRGVAITERSPLMNRRDSPRSTDDDGEDDNLIEDESPINPWIYHFRQVPTFKNQNDPLTILLDKLAVTLHPKTVRFHPLSEEHVTFSKSEYERKNHEFFENINTIYRDPVVLYDIYEELRVMRARMPKLETIYEHPDEENAA